MPVRKMVFSPSTFDVLVWDGTNDDEVAELVYNFGGGVYYQARIGEVANPQGEVQKFLFEFSSGTFIKALQIRPGDSIIMLGRDDGFDVVPFHSLVPYEDVYVTK